MNPVGSNQRGELFQGNRPVLTGIDAHSTYCFLLEEVEHRDEDTWGYYLLEASEQGVFCTTPRKGIFQIKILLETFV